MSNDYDPPNNIPMTGIPQESVENTVTATGTVQATAYPITKANTIVTVATASTGVLLPLDPGGIFRIKNNGSSDISAYPPVGATIDTIGTVNLPATVAGHGTATTGATGSFLCVDKTHYVRLA